MCGRTVRSRTRESSGSSTGSAALPFEDLPYRVVMREVLVQRFADGQLEAGGAELFQ